MSEVFYPRFKQPLAAALGAEQRDYSTLVLARGAEQIRIESFGKVVGERRLGFRVVCPLDCAERHGAGAGYRQDPRPRLEGQPEILLRWETDKDRKGKRWRLNREVQTGDQDFDDRFYVESTAPEEHIRAVLGSAETRRIVKILFEHHCQFVGINKEDTEAQGTHKREGELTVEWRTYALTDASFPQLVEALKWLTEQTLSLRASLPLFAGEVKAVRRRWRVKWTYITLALLPVLAVVTNLLAEGPIDPQAYLILGGVGFAALTLFVPLAYLLARGHTSAVGHFKGLLVVGLITIPWSVLMLGVGTNWLFDTSRPQAHEAVVVGKPRCGRKNKDYADVRDWRDNRSSITVRLRPRGDCEATKPRDTLVVVARDGYWGWMWVEDAHRPR